MHGVIFFLLQRFADNAFGSDGWNSLFEQAGLPTKVYSPATSHPDEELLKLVGAAAEIANRPVNEIVESFGEYIAPELLALHPEHVDKKWKTLDLVVNTETVLHRVVRNTDPEAEPPVLRAQYVSHNEVQLIYASPRKMCPLVKGIVRGCSRHFREAIEIEEDACMHQGDPFCSFRFRDVARRNSLPESEIDLPDTVGPGAIPNINAKSGSAWDLGEAEKISAEQPSAPGSIPNDSLTHLGNYQVLGELGRGGMGIVYVAKDPMLDREVAIKALLPELASLPVMRERFVREARSVASLRHDRIIPIFHVGDEGSIPYMVMPRLIGVDLGGWLDEGNRPTIPCALQICLQVADGLQAAHEQNLIHRDIKPSNIWLEAPKGHVKLMDFGLCRALEELNRVTTTGALVGTPLYMAPETPDGEVDLRCDIYSLGVVLYQLLCGKAPFEANSPVAILAKALTKDPEPLCQANEEISPELENFVFRAMEKNPDDRFSSAKEFYDQLRTIYASMLQENPEPYASE